MSAEVGRDAGRWRCEACNYLGCSEGHVTLVVNGQSQGLSHIYRTTWGVLRGTSHWSSTVSHRVYLIYIYITTWGVLRGTSITSSTVSHRVYLIIIYNYLGCSEGHIMLVVNGQSQGLSHIYITTWGVLRGTSHWSSTVSHRVYLIYIYNYLGCIEGHVNHVVNGQSQGLSHNYK